MPRLKDSPRGRSKPKSGPQTVPGTQWAQEPVWKLLGYQSEADYDVLAKATDCGLCGKPLPKFHRYRITPPLEAPAGGWMNKWREREAETEHRTGEADVCVCSTCKSLTDLGQWPVRQTAAELLQGRLFD